MRGGGGGSLRYSAVPGELACPAVARDMSESWSCGVLGAVGGVVPLLGDRGSATEASELKGGWKMGIFFS